MAEKVFRRKCVRPINVWPQFVLADKHFRIILNWCTERCVNDGRRRIKKKSLPTICLNVWRAETANAGISVTRALALRSNFVIFSAPLLPSRNLTLTTRLRQPPRPGHLIFVFITFCCVVCSLHGSRKLISAPLFHSLPLSLLPMLLPSHPVALLPTPPARRPAARIRGRER